MGRSRYKILHPTAPHFLTCTVLHWIALFTRPESVAIILESFRHLQQNDHFKLHAYVILENHLHIVAQSNDIGRSMAKFKAHTAKELIRLLEHENVRTILDQLAFYKKAHKNDRAYQVWQEGMQPKCILDEKMMRAKIEYIHNNPVKRGYVDHAEHWLYSSARDYVGSQGLVEIEHFW